MKSQDKKIDAAAAAVVKALGNGQLLLLCWRGEARGEAVRHTQGTGTGIVLGE